jgi:transcriptional regulator with XRE-family HTH domain
MGVVSEHKVIGARLRHARTTRGLSQERVAEALGIPRTSVSAMESGNRKVTGAELRRMARLYYCTVAWLLDTGNGYAAGGLAPELTAVVNGLSEADREQVLCFAQFLASRSAATPG